MIGLIGGSGLYEMEGITSLKEKKLETPFGAPSDSYIIGKIAGKEVAFLPRHGRGHKILPGELNFRANIYGFKLLGVNRIIAVNACGSLREEIKPLDIVLPDQFFDRTNQARKTTFFGNRIAVHISFADPVCPELIEILHQVGTELGAAIHKGGTYLNMEGPAFSTKAESRVYRQWGMDVIGMTALGEAKLAREAEICYATMAMVTDYDCWHEKEETVVIGTVIDNLRKNAGLAKRIIRESLIRIPEDRKCPCACALENAIITDRASIPPEVREKLAILVDKYL
jgi:5'-methylthioadenosine phosphorylase